MKLKTDPYLHFKYLLNLIATINYYYILLFCKKNNALNILCEFKIFLNYIGMTYICLTKCYRFRNGI